MGLLDDAIREHLELKRSRGADERELSRQEAEAFGPARREPQPAPADDLDDLGPSSLEGAEEPLPPAAAEPEAAWDAEEDPAPYADAASHAPESDLLEPAPDAPFEPDAAHAGDEPIEPELAEEPPPRDETQAFDVVAAFEDEDEPEPLAAPDPDARHAPDDLPPLADSQLALDDDEPVPPSGRSGDTPPYGVPALADEGDGELDPAIDEPLQHAEAAAAAGEPAGEDEDVLEETPDFLQDAPEHDRLWFEQRPPRDFDFDE